MKLFGLAVATAAISLASCSTGSSGKLAASTQTSATISTTSADLYRAFAAIPQATVAANFHTLQGFTPEQYYALKGKLTTRGTMIIDGRTVANELNSATRKAQIAAMSSNYPTMGDYWRSLGITTANISEADFSKGLQAILGHSATSLNLTSTPPFGVGGFCADEDKKTLTQTTQADLGTVLAAANSATRRALAPNSGGEGAARIQGTDYTVESTLNNGAVTADGLSAYHGRPPQEDAAVSGAMQNCFAPIIIPNRTVGSRASSEGT